MEPVRVGPAIDPSIPITPIGGEELPEGTRIATAEEHMKWMESGFKSIEDGDFDDLDDY